MVATLVFVSVLLIVFAIMLWHKTVFSRLFASVLAITVFVALFLIGLYFVSDYLTGYGIDESVVYHLLGDKQGAGYADLIAVMILSALYVLAISVIAVMVYRNALAANRFKIHFRLSAALTALFMSFYLNPAVSDIHQLYQSNLAFEQSNRIPEHYVESPTISFKKSPKNVVYLYLESMESTYFDETLFPGLVPNLTALQSQAISFSDIGQVSGTGWTIAGMTASQCGIPLVMPTDNDEMPTAEKFLPGAYCIGDILHNQGYQLNFMGGASLAFAGKGNFYSTHGFDRVDGLEELVGQLPDKEYQSAWGLYDDSLFALAKSRFDYLAQSKQPFGLFLLTLDTHKPKGHISQSCANVEYADGSNPILNAVHCADKMAADFIQHIRQSKAFDNTVLVVGSDHLAMRNSAWDQLQQADQRRNLLMVFAKNQSPTVIKKPGSTLDIAPTVLSMLGANSEALGYGRSLLALQPSLVELDTPIEHILDQGRGYLASLWVDPAEKLTARAEYLPRE